MDNEVKEFHNHMANSMSGLMKAFNDGFAALDKAKKEETPEANATAQAPTDEKKEETDKEEEAPAEKKEESTESKETEVVDKTQVDITE